MSNVVNDAIAKAKAAAAEQAPIEMAKVPATSHGNGAVATYAAPAAPTLDTLVNSGANVDEWLKAGEEGFKIGLKPGLVEKFKVFMSLKDINIFWGVRYSNPAVYKKSFDHVTCVEGGTWEAAVAQARAADPQCRGEYVGATLSMTISEDVVNQAGTVVLEKGKRLGHTTSVTGGKTVSGLITDARKAGISEDTLMEVEVFYIQKTKPNVKPWGVLGFTILGVAEEDSE